LAAHPPWQVTGKASNPEQYNLGFDKLPVMIKIHKEKVHQVVLAVGRMVNYKGMFIPTQKEKQHGLKQEKLYRKDIES
jgi:hypothetical protein